MIEIASDALAATINPVGAELWSLRDAEGRELMTDADPAFWRGRAPILFPIVGALNGDQWRMDGQSWSMPKHGIVRRRTFAVVEQAAARVVLRLTDDAETRASYPFAFGLEVEHAIDGATLATTVHVTNRDDRDMPASLGFHPAFAWPLPYGAPRAEHRILFDQDEPGSLAQILDESGVIGPVVRATPVEGRVLTLRDDLFEHDALIWRALASRSVRYGAASGGPQLRVDFADLPMLGIWTKPGARFVCIEPWHGIADPQGFAGDIWDKPGILRFAPGETREFAIQVTLEG